MSVDSRSRYAMIPMKYIHGGMDDEVVIFGDFRADNTVTSLGLKAGLTSCSEGNDSM